MKKEKLKREAKKPSIKLATAALAINTLLITAGLGTILGGNVKKGLIQFLLVVIGGSMAVFGFQSMLRSLVLGVLLVMTGVLMVLAGWVWAIISGVILIRKAS